METKETKKTVTTMRGSTQEEFRAIRLDIADCWPTTEGAEA